MKKHLSTAGLIVVLLALTVIPAVAAPGDATLSVNARNDKPGPVDVQVKGWDDQGNLVVDDDLRWTADDNSWSNQAIDIPKNTRVLRFTFVNDHFEPDQGPDRDRNAYIDYFMVNNRRYEAEDWDWTGGPDPDFPGAGVVTFDGKDVADCGNEGDWVEYDLQGPKAPPRTRTHGQSNVGHLLLMHKTDDTGIPPWDPIWPGAFGVLKYNREGPEFEYLFNGHGLDENENTEYSLIYYADPWPGNNPGALIASGTTDNEGNLHLKGSIDLEMDLPHPGDENFPDGAKIWLIPSSDYDIDNTKLIAWNPTEYLFEYDLIKYDDTDEDSVIQP